MGKIVIFGAGGRAGQQAVTEARRRGHQVVAVVRDPAAHAAVGGAGVELVAGDVTDAASVAAAAQGCDAGISAAVVYGEGTDPDAFFRNSSRALTEGLRQAGVGRLVVVGLASLLADSTGAPLMDQVPEEFRPFSRAHGAGLDILRSAADAPDWVYVSPAGDFDHDGERTGSYRVRDHGDFASRISYADFAIVLLTEVDAPAHHRMHLAVERA